MTRSSRFKRAALNVTLFCLVTVPSGHVTTGLGYVISNVRAGWPHPESLGDFVRMLVNSLIIVVIPTFWLACVVLWILFGGFVVSRIADSTRPGFTGATLRFVIAVVGYVAAFVVLVPFSQQTWSWEWWIYGLWESFKVNSGTMLWLTLQGALMHRYLRWFS